MDYISRLNSIVYTAYSILCYKIKHRSIEVYNEASMQMQFAIILKQLGALYEFSSTDSFSVELEKWINLDTPTCKSPKKRSRCDVWVEFKREGKCEAQAAIELKYFNYSKTTEATTDNRFSLLLDIENLERYQVLYPELECYAIVYTNNVNYTKCEKETNSSIKLSPFITRKITRTLTKNNKATNVIVDLRRQYVAEWVKFDDGILPDKRGNYFLMIDLKKYKEE